MLIARLVNHRNPHVAMLALALLDTLVQSCGYPIYLQIATKDFLNELVRRFPERPPPFPSPVMSRVLDLINTWKDGICVESKWKDDLGNIRDMHRLLSFKGYRFRQIPRAAPSASATSVRTLPLPHPRATSLPHRARPQNLKSAEELESEDRAAQSAKLQELIRRGTPRDLAAAQELMKALAGADPDARPDYRTQALAELNKLEQKVILLNEILDNVDTAQGEQFARGDVYEVRVRARRRARRSALCCAVLCGAVMPGLSFSFLFARPPAQQVASILVASRPKIQKWISDAESDDPESLGTPPSPSSLVHPTSSVPTHAPLARRARQTPTCRSTTRSTPSSRATRPTSAATLPPRRTPSRPSSAPARRASRSSTLTTPRTPRRPQQQRGR